MDYGIHISKDDHLKKDQELRSLLIDIYSDSAFTGNLQEYYNRFYNLYILTCNNPGNKDTDADGQVIDLYRHSYSSIFQTLSALRTQDQDSLEEFPDKIKTLLEYAFRESKNSQQDEAKSRLRNALYKLYDHVLLDVLRLNQIEYLTGDFDEKTNQTKNQINALSKDFDNRSDKLNDKLNAQIKAVSKNISKVKIDVVAILGIFAAIIIGFVAPMVFSSQLLANLKDTPAGKIMIASAVCGIVTIVVFYMIYVILERIVFNAQSEKLLFGKWGVALVLLLLSVILTVGLCRSDNQQQSVPSKNPENSVTIHQLINTADMPQEHR